MTKQEIAEQRARMLAEGNLLVFTRAEALKRLYDLKPGTPMALAVMDPMIPVSNEWLRINLAYVLRNNVEITG